MRNKVSLLRRRSFQERALDFESNPGLHLALSLPGSVHTGCVFFYSSLHFLFYKLGYERKLHRAVGRTQCEAMYQYFSK